MSNYNDIDFDTEGHTKGEVIEAVIHAGYSFKDACKYWAENGAGAKQTGFRNKFYAELVETNMQKTAVKEYCAEHGSKHDAKAWTHYAAIADLVAAVRLGKFDE